MFSKFLPNAIRSEFDHFLLEKVLDSPIDVFDENFGGYDIDWQGKAAPAESFAKLFQLILRFRLKI